MIVAGVVIIIVEPEEDVVEVVHLAVVRKELLMRKLQVVVEEWHEVDEVLAGLAVGEEEHPEVAVLNLEVVGIKGNHLNLLLMVVEQKQQQHPIIKMQKRGPIQHLSSKEKSALHAQELKIMSPKGK